jgi:hypothetical protein
MTDKLMQKARVALAMHPRCGAHAKQAGRPCRGYAVKNGRCRMHGGKSTGRPIIHGRYSRATVEQCKKDRQVLRVLRELLRFAKIES